MQKLLPALLAILFLAACASSSVEPSAKTASDNFERNLECQKLRPQVEDYFSDARGENSIESIFYSPKQNSCLYLLISVENISDEFFSSWEIRDVFTNKVLEIFSSLPYVTSTVSNVSEFQEKIEEYQN